LIFLADLGQKSMHTALMQRLQYVQVAFQQLHFPAVYMLLTYGLLLAGAGHLIASPGDPVYDSAAKSAAERMKRERTYRSKVSGDQLPYQHERPCNSRAQLVSGTTGELLAGRADLDVLCH
jgi:hypothetical protein